MTKEEAIETLRANYPDACYEQLRGAVDMAIEALQEQKQGEWLEREYVQVYEDGYESAICSECGAEITLEYPYDNFCPNCGAGMRGEEV